MFSSTLNKLQYKYLNISQTTRSVKNSEIFKTKTSVYSNKVKVFSFHNVISSGAVEAENFYQQKPASKNIIASLFVVVGFLFSINSILNKVLENLKHLNFRGMHFVMYTKIHSISFYPKLNEAYIKNVYFKIKLYK